MGVLACRAQGASILVRGTGSMEPLFPLGSVTRVEIEPVAFSELKAGMIVVYDRREIVGWQHYGLNGSISMPIYRIVRVAHRLKRVSRDGKFWTAEGDSNLYSDGDAVTAKNYVGVLKLP